MPKRKLPTVGVNLEPDLHEALAAFAEERTAGNVSEALRLILRDRFSAGGLAGLGEELEHSGYDAGMRQGLSEARRAIARALNGMWKRGQ